MDEDLNIPGALAALMDFVREGNALLDSGAPAPASAMVAFDRATGVLQVVPAEAGASDIPIEVRALAEERQRHRREKNWAKADEVRKLLLEKGFDVRDAKDGGYELRRVK